MNPDSIPHALKDSLIANGDAWSVLGLAGLAGLAAIFVFAAARRHPRPLPKAWLAALGLAALAGAAGTVAFAPHPDDAVVTTDDASLSISPIENAEPTTPVAAGATVRIENIHGTYAFVRTASDDSGWLPQASLDRYVGDWGED